MSREHVVYYVLESLGDARDPAPGESLEEQLAHPGMFTVRCTQGGVGADTLLLGDVLRELPFGGTDGTPHSLRLAFRAGFPGMRSKKMWLHTPLDDVNAPVPCDAPGVVFMKILVTSCRGFVGRPIAIRSRSVSEDSQDWVAVDEDGEFEETLPVHSVGEGGGDIDADSLESFAMQRAMEESRRLSAEGANVSRGKVSKSSKSRSKVKSKSKRRTKGNTTLSQERTDGFDSPSRSGSGKISRHSVDGNTTKSSSPQKKSSKGGFFSGIVNRAAKAAKAAVGAVRSVVSKDTVITFASGRVVKKSENPIAEGGFAMVYAAQSTESPEGAEYALKLMYAQDRRQLEEAKKEIQLHQKVGGHENVMELVDFMIRESTRSGHRAAKEVILLYPMCRQGSVFDLLQVANEDRGGAWPFPELIALDIFLQTCAGVRHIHKSGFAHRDIKPHNVMLFNNEDSMSGKRAVVIDLGSAGPIKMKIAKRGDAMNLQDECDSKCSPPYRAQELFNPQTGMVIDGRADVFSLGAMLYAMAFGHNPFEHPKRGFEKLALLNCNVKFPISRTNRFGEEYSQGFCDLIAAMLTPSPSDRLKLSSVVKRAQSLF